MMETPSTLSATGRCKHWLSGDYIGQRGCCPLCENQYFQQEAAVTRAHESMWEILFGRVEQSWTWEEVAEATRKHRRAYAIHRIKAQPFFMHNVDFSGSTPLYGGESAGK